ncbi:hypothetical protein ACJMK2_001700 [Sinanodonta woodiana]|uniref:Uncharacterized protein n=1 Tax=Sinanodonta woodiana TaxID=1069815 RepID=A0ABD3XT20_SINWO
MEPSVPRESGDGSDKTESAAGGATSSGHKTKETMKETVTNTKTETTTSEFTSFEEIEMEHEQFEYVPPQDDTLPDLYRLLDSLETGEGDLDAQRQPPSLFTRPEHIPSYEKITELRQRMETEEMSPYLEHFEEGIKEDVVMLGHIKLDEVQEEEKHLRDEHIRYMEQEAKLRREREQEILAREEQAKKHVAKFTKDKRTEVARREEILLQREKLLMDRLHLAFRRAESQLISVLEKRKGEVKTFYGDLMMADGQYGGSRGRRWKVDWDKTPQPIQVKLKCLRGVKDKLPGGRYVMMVSLYDRLGGHVLRWSKMTGQLWGGATLPVSHDGLFYNVEMKMDQSMFTVVPPKASIRPGMVLIFELFLLRGAVVHTDRVVGWGCFPICDAQFEIIEGRYKCPFLRGEMDVSIDKHEKVEELIASDLDHWLCNLYFEIVKLPRFLSGQNEYEVELQFSSSLTAYPDRRNIGEEYLDGEKPVLGSQSDVGDSQKSSQASIGTSSTAGVTKSERVGSGVRIKKDFKQKDFTSTIGSRVLHKDKKLDLMLMEGSDAEDSEPDDIKAIKGEEEFKNVQGMPGMYYKRYMQNPMDLYHDKLFSLLPKTSITDPPKHKKTLTHVEELETHVFAVQKPFSDKGRFRQVGNERMQYIGRQFLSELGFSQWRSKEFWGMLLLLMVVFFIRMFMHYIGQWLFLSAIKIPINMFSFQPYTVDLNYQESLMNSRQEILVVVLGPVSNIVIFSFLVFFAWAFQRLFNFFPDFGCKFIMSYGIHTILDPILILIVDCALGRYKDDSITPTADFAKLWWHFTRVEGSGLAGVFITVFLYIFTIFISGAILYMYFLRLHNNGRLLDMYWRLKSLEEKFFIPYDLEISNQELSYIVNKAEMWRGEEGERRKVAVYDYIWEEEDIDDTVWNENTVEQEEDQKKEGHKEVTTHISIHVIHLDGLRELYRHFLRLPDGAIVEVFGDLSIPGMDKDVKAAIGKGSKDFEKLMGSQASLSKIPGRKSVITRSGFRSDTFSPSPSSSSSDLHEKKKMM